MNLEFIVVDPIKDIELIFYWRQNPLVTQYLIIQDKPLVWTEHKSFWSDYKNRIDWIIFLDGRRIGSVYFKIINQILLDIGIYVADVNLRGGGIGTASILFALKWAHDNDYKTVKATVHKKNEGSIRLFKKSGFSLIGDHTNTDFSLFEVNIAKW